jgi:hypothetical protein
MSRSPLRPAAAPHTNKVPEACPHCGSHTISRKGVRKKKLEIVGEKSKVRYHSCHKKEI